MSLNYIPGKGPATINEIFRVADEITAPNQIADPELRRTYKLARALDQYLAFYFVDATRPILSHSDINFRIDQIFEDCYNDLVPALTKKKEAYRISAEKNIFANINLFAISGAENLYLANEFTRVITEKLGHRFDDIASLSNNGFNPKSQLGINIRGVDIIVYHNNLFRYTQIKTKRDTLTGSQVPRSNLELSIHQHSIFAAALAIGKRWTFNNNKNNLYPVERLAGKEFWDLLGLDYSYILKKSKELIYRLECYFYPTTV